MADAEANAEAIAEADDLPASCTACKGTGKKGPWYNRSRRCKDCEGSGAASAPASEAPGASGEEACDDNPLAAIARGKQPQKADPVFFGKGKKGDQEGDDPDAVSPFHAKPAVKSAKGKEVPVVKEVQFRSDSKESGGGIKDRISRGRRRLSLQLGWQDEASDDDMPPEKRLNKLAEEIQQFREVDEFDRQYGQGEEPDVPWVDGIKFDIGVCFLILSNVVAIAVETDVVHREGTRHVLWIVLEGVLCLCFMVELVLKVKVHTVYWFIGRNLNFIPLISCLALLVDVVLDIVEAFTPVGTNGTWRLISLIRIIYLLRMKGRIPDSWSWLKELKLVVKGLMDVMRTLVWVIVLLGVFLYVCAIVMTTQVGQNTEIYSTYRKLSGGWDHEVYFGSVGVSMSTLLRMMTLEGWFSKIGRHIVTNQGFMMPFLLFFLFMSMYGVMNFIVSMIVEKTLESVQANQDKKKVREERARRAELNSIREIFAIADTDGSGELDIEEFKNGIKNPEVVWRMTKLELPIDDAMRLFAIMDGDGSRELTMQEFIDGCMKLKGVAMSKDMLKVQGQADALAEKMDQLSGGLHHMEDSLETLDEITKRMTLRFTSNVMETRQRRAHKVGGSAPTKPQPKQRPGASGGGDVPLSIGNRPDLPRFPDLLR